MAKISVIVPNYNNGKFLERCLTSLENQTEKDIEFLLMDDASTDNSMEIMERYHNRDKRFKLISLPQNEGVSIARNKGIDLSMGTYIGFVDSDDFVEHDYYEKLSSILDQDKAPLVVSCNYWDKRLKNGLVEFRKPGRKIIEGGPSVCCHLFTRELIGEDRFIEHCRFEDSPFTYLMRMKANKMIATDQVRYHYCTDNENSFNDILCYRPQSILDLFKISEFLEQRVKNNQFFSIYRNQIKEIGIESFYAMVEILPEIATSFEECCDLVSHLAVIMNKKYKKSMQEISSYHNPNTNAIYFDNYSEYEYQQQYLSMELENCEQDFKTKIKTMITANKKGEDIWQK